MKKINLIFGTMTIGEQIFDDTALEFLRYCISGGINELDTAYVYNDGKCEEILGRTLENLNYPEIKVSTKVNPRVSGRLDGEAVYMQVNESLRRLRLKNVNTVYLHFPDENTPIDSALSACTKLHEEGKFRELGLSNFPGWLVEEICLKCKEQKWIVPTVYQGLYNPLSRLAENELFPVIRQFDMRFYAYNPLAGGLLTDKYGSFEQKPEMGRFTYRPNYQNRYWHESFFEAVALLKEACADENISIIDAVYRWLAFHSALDPNYGDAIIIGASKLDHLKQNAVALEEGPLSENLIGAFEKAWKISKEDAPPCFRFYKGKGKD